MLLPSDLAPPTTAAYRRRRIRERFTIDLLAEHLAALGVPITPPDCGRALLVRRVDPVSRAR